MTGEEMLGTPLQFVLIYDQQQFEVFSIRRKIVVVLKVLKRYSKCAYNMPHPQVPIIVFFSDETWRGLGREKCLTVIKKSRYPQKELTRFY